MVKRLRFTPRVFVRWRLDRIDWQSYRLVCAASVLRNHNDRVVRMSGFDQTLCLSDVANGPPKCTRRIELPAFGGSIRWNEFNGDSKRVSVTTDDGNLRIYDWNAKNNNEAILNFHGGKVVLSPSLPWTRQRRRRSRQDLYAHDYYTEYNIMLGYGDGVMQFIDIRNTTEVYDALGLPPVR
jgi:hypothetical protein